MLPSLEDGSWTGGQFLPLLFCEPVGYIVTHLHVNVACEIGHHRLQGGSYLRLSSGSLEGPTSGGYIGFTTFKGGTAHFSVTSHTGDRNTCHV